MNTTATATLTETALVMLEEIASALTRTREIAAVLADEATRNVANLRDARFLFPTALDDMARQMNEARADLMARINMARLLADSELNEAIEDVLQAKDVRQTVRKYWNR